MAAATSVVVLDRGNNTTCTVNLHGKSKKNIFFYYLHKYIHCDSYSNSLLARLITSDPQAQNIVRIVGAITAKCFFFHSVFGSI